MIIRKKVKIIQEHIEKVICDICKKEFDRSTNEGKIEIQEFQYLRIRGGFGSVFGDGCVLDLDMCQHCTKELLGKYFSESFEDFELYKNDIIEEIS
jgi:antitoxin CcdA